MQAMQSNSVHNSNSLGFSSISAPSLRPCKPARACLALQASKKQQQPEQQQPAPVNNFRDLMQQYRSIGPATPTTQKKFAASNSSSASSSKKDTKGAPRLKPTQQTSAPASSASKRRAAAAAAAGSGGAGVSSGGARVAAKSRAGGFGSPAAGERTSSKASKSKAADSSSSSSSSAKSSNNSSSSSSAESSKSRSSQRSVIPSAWLMPSNGKGFGSPPAAVAAPTRTPGGQKIIRVFRFGVEAAAVSKAVEANGWQGRVVLVESIREADLILAAKCSSGGKHRNLAQGEKAAANAKIPFVIVGRKLSADNFRQALVPHVEPNSKEAAALAAAAVEAAAKAAANKAAADAFFRSAGGWGKPPR